MAARLNAYLSFDGTARAAMEFYRDVFGGELDVTTMGEFGRTGPEADLIMHSQLVTAEGYWLMGADTPPEMTYTEGARAALILHGDDEALLRGQFERLAEGGSITTPLEQQMWGDIYGSLTDKFGIGWMVNIDGQPPQA